MKNDARCVGACVETRRWSLSRVCCCLAILRQWKRDPVQQLSMIKSAAAHGGLEHADRVLAAYNAEGR